MFEINGILNVDLQDDDESSALDTSELIMLFVQLMHPYRTRV